MNPGERDARLTLLERIPGTHKVRVKWKCKCDCGNVRIVLQESIRSGNTQSCGCLMREINSESHTKHGYRKRKSRSRTWGCWEAMIARCNNPKCKSFPNYGGRGIKVCDEWSSFERFKADMGEIPQGMTLGRIDNSIGYCKSNCRWETRKQQIRNRRVTRMLTVGDATKPLAEWAELNGIVYGTLLRRINRGWEPQKAIIP